MVNQTLSITNDERAALERLLVHAQSKTRQGHVVADFLLAWWNPARCGSFAPSAAWELDAEIADDVAVVFALAVRCQCYPDVFGYGQQFEQLVQWWRPELA
ncbi:DUF7673 family protein [Ralstonia sp. 25C]|uniref:DUF7673 family protein n=1 Tax=Ralstonia sp. 25C TaxID=3447363 RepID=UPI003F750550